jgi:type I restriction enzyme R subunit
MNDDVGKPERATQERIITLFEKRLGYTYLGDWADRPDNSNVEESYLSAWLARCGYSQTQISAVIHRLKTEARNPTRSLYENNQEVYGLLRYGVSIKSAVGEMTETIPLINWDEPEKNDFAIAEEVTLSGDHDRRPDLVLYVNGIAIGVIELKNSRISMGNGIRQNLSNQQPEFHPWFFSTVHLVFAGNDSEGLKYGTVLTPEKFFVAWKEDEADNAGFKIDKYLSKMCEKSRIIELMRHFVLFDNGWKKLPRPHQYFAVKAAQEHVERRENGIIWHVQGSGKSIVMVLLAKWILENVPNGRIVVITDRDELDKQIEGVFNAIGEKMIRTSSGRDLLQKLGQATPRLLCSLIHKFGPRNVDNFEAFIKDLGNKPSPTVGEIFVFVDECHRTQSGKLHRAMRAIMPDAVFIGFTGTPLLKKDSQTTLELFERYIHTYKFDEGVKDGVILDLVYDARDIDQRLGSPDKIDQWFTAKTQGLNDWQKNELKKQWSTMQKVLSSRSRMERVVDDIVFDFATKPRLSSGLGNAILVASSIYEASRYFELFQHTPLKGKCGLVTSYNPQVKDITLEETGANTETEKQSIYNTYTALLENVIAKSGKSKTETYEDNVKAKFIEEPLNMNLLIVVDKLLTGFDAPPCSVLYIDKTMQDHGLFQAICRTNRLDDESKKFGTIVDYKNLFKKVEGAMAVYTSELDHTAPGPEPEILIQDRITRGKQRLEDGLETLFRLTENVEAPQGELEHIHYFCGNSELEADLEETQPKRVALYRATVELVRAVADLADEMEAAGYTSADIQRVNQERNKYVNIRDLVRRASGETLDLKPFEADMRHLIDTYIDADAPRRIFSSEDTGLLDLISKEGIERAIERQFGRRANADVIAETIENNIRKTIVKERLADPIFYENMSALLKEVIAARKSKAIEYEEYLKRIAAIAEQANAGRTDGSPPRLDSPGKRALWNNLGQNEDLALRLDEAIRQRRPDGWRGMLAKERKVKEAIYDVLQDEDEVERIFSIVKAQDEY